MSLSCFDLAQIPGFGAEQIALRDTLHRFVQKEIAPHVSDWDEAGGFPRQLYQRAAAIGLLGLGYPEQFGGTECGTLSRLTVSLELGRAGIGGVGASLLSHTIMVPPLLEGAPDALQVQVLPELFSGAAIGCLAVTEPDGGSDVAALRCRAEPVDGGYRLFGSKMFITSGMRADYLLVAARLADATGSAGRAGLSLFLLDGRDCPGLHRSVLRKTGWWASDTAALAFDGCFVPAANLVGKPHGGFALIMRNFNAERLALAATAVGAAICCCEDALDHARNRMTFGKRLIDHQVIRHKIVQMVDAILPMIAWLQTLAARFDRGEQPAAEVALAKNRAGRLMRDCADTAVQILGGAGFMRGSRVERIYRDVKVMMIGGGAEEVLNDLAARQFDL